MMFEAGAVTGWLERPIQDTELPASLSFLCFCLSLPLREAVRKLCSDFDGEAAGQ